MLTNFSKVTDGLYRGSAPTISDVVNLYKEYGIRKIISLDENAGISIRRICDKLNIEHFILPINGQNGLSRIFKFNLKDLLLDGGPTYIHCRYGKDRTGLIVALFQCKYNDYNAQEALDEAKTFGFGIGLSPKLVEFYSNLILRCNTNNSKDSIVDNERSGKGSNSDSVLTDGTRMSFAPFLPIDFGHKYPFPSYNSTYDQADTSANHELNKKITEYIGAIDNDVDIEDKAVLVGLYNNDAGLSGLGPTINMTGFITE